MSELNVLLGENGSGKTNILEAIIYFFNNLTRNNIRQNVFDKCNRFSNEIRISVYFDLSSFEKISKSQYEPDFYEGIVNSEYNNYFKSILSLSKKAKTSFLPVVLTQIKGKEIRWNCSYEDRQIISSLFPLFYVDTRSLDLNEWSYIWDALGELSKVSNPKRDQIEEKINSVIAEENKEISEKLKGIERILDSADVSVKKWRAKDFAINLSKMHFSGDVLQKNEKNLNYYSSGTNSVQYIELLLKTVDEISRKKLKEPIVIFDEPEISLHPRLVDELADEIISVNSKLSIMLSTHSPRLVKNLIVKSNASTVFDVKIQHGYSTVKCIKKFTEYAPESKCRVTDEHINSYFSKAVLFVEGETELELFSNPYLLSLFPKLKQVDVLNTMAQGTEQKIVNPKLAHRGTPYICLVDMDKVFRYDKSANRFSLKNELAKEDNKDFLTYHSKKYKGSPVIMLRKRIDAMANKLKVHYYLPYYSCNDKNYIEFLDTIQEYFLNHNIFVFKTTLEGALINKNNMSRAIEFLEKKKKQNVFNQFEEYFNGLLKTDKINCLRLIFNGKSDLLQDRDKLPMDEAKRKILENMSIGKKANGWITEYMNSFFESYITSGDCLTPKAFQKVLSNKETYKQIRKDFAFNFPELYFLIVTVCDIIF